MHCPIRTADGSAIFLAYGSRSLPADAEAALELHLASCQECNRVATAQRMVWSTLDSWEPPSISHDFDRRLYARIAREEESPWYKRWFHLGFLDVSWPHRPAMPVAAACFALLAAFLYRTPVLDTKPVMPVQTKNLDMEQVERALDDIDMLNQLGVVPPASAKKPHSESM